MATIGYIMMSCGGRGGGTHKPAVSKQRGKYPAFIQMRMMKVWIIEQPRYLKVVLHLFRTGN